jgi:hypothetical protein
MSPLSAKHTPVWQRNKNFFSAKLLDQISQNEILLVQKFSPRQTCSAALGEVAVGFVGFWIEEKTCST